MSLRDYLHPRVGHGWKVGNTLLAPSSMPLLMGIVNVTPDSFFDGGKHDAPDAACAHALRLLDEGAQILDIGGESARPGAQSVEAAEELARVLPVISFLHRETSRRDFYISIDTVKSEVARAAMKAGAHIVNDISAMELDTAMADVVLETGASVVLQHMQGVPRTMQQNPVYHDVVNEVRTYLGAKAQGMVERGMDPACICVDPGICFGKRQQDNLQLIAAVDELLPLGFPIMMGMSRKSYIGKVDGLAQSDRLMPSVLSAAVAALGGTSVLRVHDVAPTREALLMLKALITC